HALAGARLRGRIRSLDAAALAAPVRIVPPHAPLGDLDPTADLSAVLVLDRSGARPGIVGRASRVDPAAAASVPAAQRAGTPVCAVAGPLGEIAAVPAALRGEELVDAMLSLPAPAYLVLDEAGAPRGV